MLDLPHLALVSNCCEIFGSGLEMLRQSIGLIWPILRSGEGAVDEKKVLPSLSLDKGFSRELPRPWDSTSVQSIQVTARCQISKADPVLQVVDKRGVQVIESKMAGYLTDAVRNEIDQRLPKLSHYGASHAVSQ